MKNPSDATEGLATWRAPAIQPEAAQRLGVDSFVRGAVLGHAIFAVVGRDGIAAVPSPTSIGKAAYLFWSSYGEAERWADVLATDPKIVSIDLPGFLSVTLPEMARCDALAGIDWTAEPAETELAPKALAAELRDELARDFAFNACKTRLVFMLVRNGAISGILTPDGARVTPVWADRHLAEAAVAAIADPGLTAVRKPLLELTNRYLLSAEGVKTELSPGYVHASGALRMSPWALKALLNSGGRPAARIPKVG